MNTSMNDGGMNSDGMNDGDMNNSGMNDEDMNDEAPLKPSAMRAAFADGLTLMRFLLTPVVMGLILWSWPDIYPAILASALFIIAAITDFFDDVVGGHKGSDYRRFGWFDDIADNFLILGTLGALVYVVHAEGSLSWQLSVPAGIIIIRELLVWLLRGYDMSKNGWPVTPWVSLKNGLCVLAICLLLGSPWITQWVDGYRATPENIMDVYNSASPYVWYVGQAVLWVAAVFSLLTGIGILTGRSLNTENTNAASED